MNHHKTAANSRNTPPKHRANTPPFKRQVGSKDMTYSKQLKTYEDAVIAKRLEELSEDEVEALMDEMDRT